MVKIVNKDTTEIASVPVLPEADSMGKVRIPDLVLQIIAPREDTVLIPSSEAAGIDLLMIEMTAKARHSKLSCSNSEFQWLHRLGEAKALFQEPGIVIRDPIAWAREHSTNTQGLVVEDSLWYALELRNKQKRRDHQHVVGEGAILHPPPSCDQRLTRSRYLGTGLPQEVLALPGPSTNAK